MKFVFRDMMIGGMALALAGCAGGNSAPQLDARAGSDAATQPASLVIARAEVDGEACGKLNAVRLQGDNKRSVSNPFASKFVVPSMQYSDGRITDLRASVAAPDDYVLLNVDCPVHSIWKSGPRRFSFSHGRTSRQKKFSIPSGKVVSLGVIQIKTNGPATGTGQFRSFSSASRPFNEQELADIVKLKPELAGRIEHYSWARIR
ncbi:hypothetical protein [Anderseniella sp. Alg231-50]|uniref:hypothetical protein n=1 Tax=Anderseniella sp. Alg231-50 TaxID=1922226 RepID=UPI00307C08D5